MAFPSNQSSMISLGKALANLENTATQIKVTSSRVKNKATAGTLTAGELLEYLEKLANWRAIMQSFANYPGLLEYAREEYVSVDFDIVSSYITMRNAIDDVRQWIGINFPKASSGEVKERKLDASGRTVQNVFSAPFLQNLIPLLTAVIVSID